MARLTDVSLIPLKETSFGKICLSFMIQEVTLTFQQNTALNKGSEKQRCPEVTRVIVLDVHRVRAAYESSRC